jgi:hypothetical protein
MTLSFLDRICEPRINLNHSFQIRDLEMKVEVLSAEKDESFKAVNSMLHDLIAENQALRQLVKDLSTFVGDGIGGPANKVGWDPARYDEFLGRGETDTAHFAYQTWKKNSQRAAVAAPERNQGAAESTSVQPTLASVGQKRSGEDLQDGSRKRLRVSLPSCPGAVVHTSARIQRVSTASPSQPHSGTSIPGTIHIDDSPYAVNLQAEDYFPSHQNNSPPQFSQHYPTAGPSNSSGSHGLQSYRPLAQPIHPPHMANALAPIIGQPSSHLTPNTAAMVEEVYHMMGNGVSNLPQGMSQGDSAPHLTLSQKARENQMAERGSLIRFVVSPTVAPL